MEKFKFVSYYKYQFIFRAEDGETLMCGEGNSDDIYRANVKSEMTRADLEVEFGELVNILLPPTKIE